MARQENSYQLISFGMSCFILLLISQVGTTPTHRKNSFLQDDHSPLQTERRDREIHHEESGRNRRHLACIEGQYSKRFSNGTRHCLPCTQCSHGREVLRTCGRHHDTQCGDCLPGEFYLNIYLSPPTCQRCRVCHNRKIIRDCTETADAICGTCDHGYFLDELTSDCIECSYCWPEVPGFGIRIPECNQPGQPHERMCLPSSPPPSLRSLTTEKPDGEVHRTTDSIFQEIDRKLRRLSEHMRKEVEDTMNELDVLRHRVKELDTS